MAEGTRQERGTQSYIQESDKELNPGRKWHPEDQFALVEFKEPRGDDVIVERGAGFLKVPVGTSSHGHHSIVARWKRTTTAQRKSPLLTAAKSPTQNNAYPRLKNTSDHIRARARTSPGPPGCEARTS